ncbi:hypothetical protein C8A06_0459 [Microbacteriaceae bacterium MWH-Ta3]|nr:hypothetical protein C8A06_0459 [Microbacteriaceae bacterium MWH-Ta3]
MHTISNAPMGDAPNGHEAQQLCRSVAAVLASDPDFALLALTRGAAAEGADAPRRDDIDALIHWLQARAVPGADIESSAKSLALVATCTRIAAGITQIMGQSELGNSRTLQCAQDLDRLAAIFRD